MKTYIIEYIVYFNNITESHTTRVKNCENELYAKIKLEKYLQTKYNKFAKLKIEKCTEDIFSVFGGIFGDIFNPPFKK
jgi:hypothetical protein